MKFIRSLSGVCLAGLLSVTGAQAFAQQLEAHQHGQASGQLAVDSGEVSLRLKMPGFNMVGFEHPPRNDAQQRSFDLALERFNETAWWRSPAGARCVMNRLEVQTPGFGTAARGEHDHEDRHGETHDDDHDDHHDHHGDNDDKHHGYGDEHEHEHGSDQHAEFEIELLLECAQPARLAWLELDLFEGWHDNQQLRLDVLTETMVRQFDLRAGAERVDLQ